MKNQHSNNSDTTVKEPPVNLRIGEIERKIGSMQNQLTHTVTESDLQKTIATLATKDELKDGLRELRDSMREFAERTDKSISELAERTDKSISELAERTDKSISELRESIRDLQNHMYSMMRIILLAVTVVVAVAALIIKVF